MADVREDCRTAPLTRVSIARSEGSIPGTMAGPTGQKVSKDLERANCLSFFCRSRAVTSFAQADAGEGLEPPLLGPGLDAPPDHEGELAFVVDSFGLGRQNDVAAVEDERRGRLEKQQRLVLGRRVAELGRMLAVVPPDGDDLGGKRWRARGTERDHACQASSRSSPA